MSNNVRVPINWQNVEFAKSMAQKSPSWESFRSHQIHEPKHRNLGDDGPSTHAMSVMRRNPDGTLDFEWAKNMVLDAVHNLNYPFALTPVHYALLTVVMPSKYRNMIPQQAEIMTQLSGSEKYKVLALVEAQLKEEENYSAGRGGGSVEGRSQTRSGK